MRNLFNFLVINLLISLSIPIYALDLNNSNKAFTSSINITKDDWISPEELNKVWLNSYISFKTQDVKVKILMKEFVKSNFSMDNKKNIVIFAHGCSGTVSITHNRIDFLVDNGYVVIAPQSFARKKYARSCDPMIHRAGMYREILSMRHEDIRHVVRNVRRFDWVNTGQVVLMGHSEGGIIAATYVSNSKDDYVDMRIIEGWTCRSQGPYGWFEYHGLKSKKETPVLALVSKLDPWFQKEWSKGDCGKFLKNNKSKSYVFDSDYIKRSHQPLNFKEVQNITKKFMKNNLK